MLYALIGHVKTTRFTGGYYFLLETTGKIRYNGRNNKRKIIG